MSTDLGSRSVSDYNREYYAEHKEEISRKRKEKYRADPAYRQRMLEREREWREKKKQEKFELASALVKDVPRFDLSSVSHRETVVNIDGQAKLLVSSSAVAAALGVAVRTLTSWLKDGKLPPPDFHSEVSRRDGLFLRRWFSTEYVQSMYELSPWLSLGRDVFFEKVRESFGDWES